MVLAGSAVGIASAQATPTPSAPRAKFDEALANRLHITVDQLRQAIQGAHQDVGGQKPPRGFAGRGGFGFLREEAQAVAGLFKETPEQLRAELPGATLAELATKHGVSTQDVVNTIVQTADQRIDQMGQKRNLSADR